VTLQELRLQFNLGHSSRAAARGGQRVERRVVRRGSAQQVGPQHSCAHRVHCVGSAQELLWAAAKLPCIAAELVAALLRCARDEGDYMLAGCGGSHGGGVAFKRPAGWFSGPGHRGWV
jgi:hypothetical protein